jgi:hypothetical protein
MNPRECRQKRHDNDVLAGAIISARAEKSARNPVTFVAENPIHDRLNASGGII